LCRNCLLEHGIKGKVDESIAVTGRTGRTRKQLLDDLQENGGYTKLKEEALDRTLGEGGGTGCGRVCGHVARETADCMNRMLIKTRPQPHVSAIISPSRHKLTYT